MCHIVETLSPSNAQSAPDGIHQTLLRPILQEHADTAPDIAQLLQTLTTKTYPGSQLFHDHFAFRTFGVPGMGIQSVAAILLKHGYKQGQELFEFPKKKLLATWFAPPTAADYAWLPRIFVSELEVSKLSPASQSILQRYLPTAAADTQDHSGAPAPSSSSSSSSSGDDVTLSAMLNRKDHRRWSAPSVADYDALLPESDYAAWTLAHGYMLNHTAISVHRMAGVPSGDIYQFAERLAAEVPMNNEGGLIKLSPDGLLLQCSTLSSMVPFTFADGVQRSIAGPYVEFVERRAPAQLSHIPRAELSEAQLRDGFEVGNADNIFASTKQATPA